MRLMVSRVTDSKRGSLYRMFDFFKKKPRETINMAAEYTNTPLSNQMVMLFAEELPEDFDAAATKAELKKAEKAGADEAALQPLRAALAAAEQALHAAEAASGKPAPELVRTERPGVDEKFKALKTEVAFARADLRKLERDESAAGEALEQARTRLAEAERKLAEYQT